LNEFQKKQEEENLEDDKNDIKYWQDVISASRESTSREKEARR